MPNETIILRFLDFDPRKAENMLHCARQFATDKIGGKAGFGGLTAYRYPSWACIAYWTKARAVVVREVPRGLTPSPADTAAKLGLKQPLLAEVRRLTGEMGSLRARAAGYAQTSDEAARVREDAILSLVAERNNAVDAFHRCRQERDEAKADYTAAQDRYGRAWGALCAIGNQLEAVGHYTLIPERALRVGDAVAALIAERDEARDALATARIEGAAKMRDHIEAIFRDRSEWLTREVRAGGTCDVERDQATYAANKVRALDPAAVAGGAS